MGKEQDLLDAARTGNLSIVEKIAGQRSKRSGPLALMMRYLYFYSVLIIC